MRSTEYEFAAGVERMVIIYIKDHGLAKLADFSTENDTRSRESRYIAKKKRRKNVLVTLTSTSTRSGAKRKKAEYNAKTETSRQSQTILSIVLQRKRIYLSSKRNKK